MTLEGTVVNGLIVLDGPDKFPEGMRVRVEPAISDETFEYPHPLAPYEREKELALLRDRVAAFRRGERGVPVDEAFARIAAELNLPPADPE